MKPTPEQIESFQRNGYLYIPGYFSSSSSSSSSSTETKTNETTLINDLAMAAKKKFATGDTLKIGGDAFQYIEMGMLLDDGLGGRGEQNEERNIFRDICLKSGLAELCAGLMQLNPKEQNVRVLRDVFLSRGVNYPRPCGWHVDDQGFWPENFDSSASDESGLDQHGINVWIPLEDHMPSIHGGSMAIASGSHKAAWRYDAYKSIGHDLTKSSGLEKEDLIHKIQSHQYRNPVCLMKELNETMNETIEESMTCFDYRRGDVLLSTRWLFHKTVPMTEEGKEYYKDLGIEYLHRYSIRFVPGSARLPTGFATELSILSNAENAGRTLDEVEDPWYPKCWPIVEDDIDEQLEKLKHDKLDEAKKAKDDLIATLFGTKKKE